MNINGYEIPDRFMPGWSNYFRHIDLCRYDITERIISGGKNTLRITVANGWYSGKLGYGNKTNVFGDEKRLFAELTLSYDDGHTDTIVSDESWKIAGSDVIAADFFDGETIDARRRGQAGKIVGNAVITDFDVPFQVYSREPVRVIESISPQVIFSDENTVRYDFGCNFAGVIRVTAQGKRGGKIVAKYGETTDENGEVYTANLRRAKCTDEFILSGGEDTFEPKFTYHGFRYAELKKSAGTGDCKCERVGDFAGYRILRQFRMFRRGDERCLPHGFARTKKQFYLYPYRLPSAGRTARLDGRRGGVLQFGDVQCRL